MQLLSLVLVFLFVKKVLLLKIHPDVGLSFAEQVKRHGYPIDIHEVITEDGYILSLFRIPYGIRGNNYQNRTENRSAVLFLHGMGGFPANWISLGPKDSLTYYLADRGYDAWIMSTRGVDSPLQRKHLLYDWNDDMEYWDFSLHDIGVYDLPANIDYIRKYTKQERIFFVGHSAACPEFFIMMSEKPEYNNKIKIGTIYGASPILKKLDYPMVILGSQLVDVVREMYSLLTSASFSRLSSRQILQYLDNLKTGEFRQYNYGSKINKKLYGTKVPPKYNLTRCETAVAFFSSTSDSFCILEDLYESMNEIPNVILHYQIPFKRFTHIDFVFGRNSTYLVYEPTYRLFKDFDEGKVPSKRGKKYIFSN
ncbi:lipase 3-like [Sitophilus oryzae]|uniref:Lipase 3-like n=1 Tax=Sitophilus oryzae TaxID=7048 RepID=A0A6J2YQ21_SITOR|nr:lipase 3-like [Sitophilus oryzae]